MEGENMPTKPMSLPVEGNLMSTGRIDWLWLDSNI